MPESTRPTTPGPSPPALDPAPPDPPAAADPTEPTRAGPTARTASTTQAARFVPSAPTGTARLVRALRARPDVGQVAVAVLVGLMGFAAALQVRIDDDELLSRASRADLIQILDGLTVRGNQLEDQIAELEADRRDLLSGADTEQAALAQTAALYEQLAVLAGTAPATGPGIVVTITDPDGGVEALTMFSAVQEMRSAGAEAIELAGAGDQQVRVVASTYLLEGDGGIEVDGVHVEPPYRFTAIGDPDALRPAMSFPQGVIDNVERDGGRATVAEHEELTVDAVHEAREPQYAVPAPDDDAG